VYPSGEIVDETLPGRQFGLYALNFLGFTPSEVVVQHLDYRTLDCIGTRLIEPDLPVGWYHSNARQIFRHDHGDPKGETLDRWQAIAFDRAWEDNGSTSRDSLDDLSIGRTVDPIKQGLARSRCCHTLAKAIIREHFAH
jgi:hypothetical protein